MNYAYNHGSQGNLLNCAPAPVQTQSNTSNDVDTKSVDEKIGASIRKAGQNTCSSRHFNNLLLIITYYYFFSFGGKCDRIASFT